jgi:chromosome segregation ATPase
MMVYTEQSKKLKGTLSEETTKLENALKQEQIAHDQTKKDLQALEEKEKENELFLMKEAKKSKKLNEEISHLKDKQKETEEELRKTIGLLKRFTEENVDLKNINQALKNSAPQTPVQKGRASALGDSADQSKTNNVTTSRAIFDSDGEGDASRKEHKSGGMNSGKPSAPTQSAAAEPGPTQEEPAGAVNNDKANDTPSHTPTNLEDMVKELKIKLEKYELSLEKKEEEIQEVKSLYERASGQIQQLQDVRSDNIRNILKVVKTTSY